MEPQFSATLTGSDGAVDGIVQHTTHSGFRNAYRFTSIDDTLHLVITKDEHGNWKRLDGTEPYLSGWVDELAEQVSKVHQ